MSIINIVLISAILANIFGVIFHFTHNIFKRSFITHTVSAVNESTWEHMKLLFSPIFIISIIQHFIYKETYTNIFESTLYGVILGLISIPIIYYPVRRILKKEIVWISILIFIISVCISYVLIYKLLSKEISYIGEWGGFIGLLIIFILFAIFTFKPPKWFIFKDPVDNKYGDKS